MENIIEESIRKLSLELNDKFEQALIDACKNKGLTLNIASAPDFQLFEFEGWKTLVHIPTNTKICKYKSEPCISTGNYDNKYTVRGEIEFIEL